MDSAYNADDFHQIPSAWNARLLSQCRDEIQGADDGADRKVIVDQAVTLISEIYPYLAFKEATEAADPVQALRLLSLRLGPRPSGPNGQMAAMSNSEVDAELSGILNTLRDAHTVYLAPGAERQRLAFLPVLIEQYGSDHYVVTKIAEGVSDDYLRVGDRITHWNGWPIADYLRSVAELTPGANGEARHARAVARMTCRWTGNGIFPPEDWVVLTYGDGRSIRCDWLVAELPAADSALRHDQLADTDRTHAGAVTRTHAGDIGRTHAAATARTHAVGLARTHAVEFGLDTATELIRRLKTALYATKSEGYAEQDNPPLLCHPLAGGAYYLRAWTFDVADVDGFVNEARVMLEGVPQEAPGLVIDMRGNPGGLIAAAYALLQLLSPEPVDPVALQFMASQRTLALVERMATYEDAADTRAALADVADGIRYALASGQQFSEPMPFSDRSLWRELNQAYRGPMVLIVDALSYSATEIFAAGFQDLKLGQVLGTAPMTGGGGGAPWPYEPLRESLDLPPLHPDCDAGVPSFDVTVRRVLRTRGSAPILLEGNGVSPDVVREMTAADVLAPSGEGNQDLIEHAVALLP